MKRLSIALLALAALVSCTEKYTPKETNYYVNDSGTFLFMASVESLSGDWTWDAARSKVGIYTPGSANVVFLPRAAYDGAVGEAQLMGPPVEGQAYAYIPWSRNGNDAASLGCQPLPEEQVYRTDAISQIEDNTPVLVAAADEEGRLDFRYLCGALHLKVQIHFSQNLQTVTLSANEPLCGKLNVLSGEFLSSSTTVSVTGIDRPCTESKPLDVWIMLPEGTYTGLYITASGESESISTVLDGSIEILAGAETEAVAREKKNNYDGSDFEAEEAEYD